MNIAFRSLFLALLIAAGSNGATLTLVPTQGAIAAGNNTVVQVLIDSATPVYGWELTLTYTASLASGLSVAEGSFLLPGGSTTFFDAVPDNSNGAFGPVAAVLNGAVPGVSGTGTLVSFTLQGLAQGTVNLSLVGASLLDETLFNIATTTTGATFDVTASEVPEPTTAALVAVSLALFALGKKRR